MLRFLGRASGASAFEREAARPPRFHAFAFANASLHFSIGELAKGIG